MKPKFKILFFCLLAVALIGCDRVTKDSAREHLKDKAAISYFNDNLRLVYTENTGAFMSLGADWSASTSFWVLTVLPLVILSGFLVVIMRKARRLNYLEMTAFILILAGGIGNLIDRMLFDRHVADFINVGIGNIRTGIFNIADLYVTTGFLLLVFGYWRKAPGKNRPQTGPGQ